LFLHQYLVNKQTNYEKYLLSILGSNIN